MEGGEGGEGGRQRKREGAAHLTGEHEGLVLGRSNQQAAADLLLKPGPYAGIPPPHRLLRFAVSRHRFQRSCVHVKRSAHVGSRQHAPLEIEYIFPCSLVLLNNESTCFGQPPHAVYAGIMPCSFGSRKHVPVLAPQNDDVTPDCLFCC